MPRDWVKDLNTVVILSIVDVMFKDWDRILGIVNSLAMIPFICRD